MKGLKIILLCAVTVIAVSCKDKDLYDPNLANPEKDPVNMQFNSFDFSTIQTVNLVVDYSSFKTYGPVFFSVYSENPFVGEGEDEHLDENIAPIFEDYTNADGKFNMNVKLPAYAKHLYVVTGNFLVSDYLIEAEVLNGTAKAVAKKPAAANRAASSRRGEQTCNVDNLPQLSYIVDENGNNTGEQIYKKWFTPLGTWDSKSGAPNYVIDPLTLTADQKKLLCTEEEIAGLYSAIGEALDANKACNPLYRNYPDLTLDKESEVVITMLGGNTCWNSSLGYYYYMSNEEPQNPADLNIIMLFPNTQDGEWSRIKSNMSYNGNIGVNRGDAVLLKYYPHIADNGDLSEATTVFPAGIKIGFILKSNGWGMQGKEYAIKGLNDGARKYNNWGASTPGTSYCRPFGEPGVNPYQFPNPNGESRSAKFAYKAPNGDKYAIISFEDACNDEDYDDVVFALKPVNAFTPLPEIENKKTTTVGVYAFEDLWPSRGDYDLNDVVVDFKHEKVMSKLKSEQDFKIYQESFYLTTYQNYVTLQSGLALKLNTPVEPSSIVMKQVAPNTTDTTEVNYRNENGVYYLTDDVKGTLGTTYILEITYAKGQTSNNLASVQPFIYRDEANDTTWEVHIPFEAPTERMNFNYFGKQDDTSVPDLSRFFVRNSDYPFAFFLFGAKIDKFTNTILKRENESKKISDIYPGFLNWSVTKGVENSDWYLHPNL